jgi:CheY-like chemotaxis protein/anti-sigma regulatory factor (Ser/Thr protein kinase)
MESELFKTKKIESLGVFAGGIAHDFNNLLTAIIGNISLARMMEPGDRQLPEILEEAEKVSIRARELTTQLLTFSRGGAPIKKLTPLHSLLADTATFVLSGSNVRSELNIARDLWNAEIDEVQISQVIHNLILNARQAMPEGGTITISAENMRLVHSDSVPLPRGDYITITIADQGSGISPDHLQNIFDPYFTTKSAGSGLGLTITYSIIKKHEGHILVDSAPGRGAVFTIFLPASAQQYHEPPGEGTAPRPVGGRLLIMDDEDIVLNVTEKMLQKLGYRVSRAKNGEEAVALYREAFERGDPFNIVIMDLTIPGGMGGQKALEAIRAFDPHVRAIVSSGYSNDPVMANYRDYGFCGVVTKPFRFNELAAALSKL